MILAQAPSPDITAWLIGTPVTVLAFGILAFVRGWIVPGQVHARTQAECEKRETELRALQATFVNSVIPALVRATDALAEAERDRSR
jgi:hypothetical protein